MKKKGVIDELNHKSFRQVRYQLPKFIPTRVRMILCHHQLLNFCFWAAWDYPYY